MKKVFVKGTLQEIGNNPSKQGQIIAFRAGSTYHFQNLEFSPKTSFEFLPSADKNELILKVRMNDGDYLVIQDAGGVAEKGKI